MCDSRRCHSNLILLIILLRLFILTIHNITQVSAGLINKKQKKMRHFPVTVSMMDDISCKNKIQEN